VGHLTITLTQWLGMMNTMAAMGTKVKIVQGTSAPPPQAAPTPLPVTTPMRMSGAGGITSTTTPAVLIIY